MRKLLIGLLVLGNISVFANECTQEKMKEVCLESVFLFENEGLGEIDEKDVMYMVSGVQKSYKDDQLVSSRVKCYATYKVKPTFNSGLPKETHIAYSIIDANTCKVLYSDDSAVLPLNNEKEGSNAVQVITIGE